MPQLILTLVLIAIGWFVLIRPQQARVREQRAMVQSLEVGDRVITAGGIHGTLIAVDDETVGVEVAPAMVLTVARMAIARRLDADDAVAAGGAREVDGPVAQAQTPADTQTEPGEGPASEGAP